MNIETTPNRFALDRMITGETTEPTDVGPEEQAHIDAVRATRPAAFDAAGLRRRAAQLEPSPTEAPPANNMRWFAAIAIAAIALLVALPFAQPSDPNTTTYRSGEGFSMHTLEHGQLEPWSGEALGEGDVVGFQVNVGAHDGAVLMSVDGAGILSVFWPENGEIAEPLEGEGAFPLPGTVTLDGTPGTEVFVVVYDSAPDAARAELSAQFQSGGHQGVLDWAEATEGVVALEVPRQ